MLFQICVFSFGILLFAAGLLIYRSKKNDPEAVKICSLSCYIGFAVWFGTALCWGYERFARSFGLIDLAVTFCLYGIAAEFILGPAFKILSREKRKTRIFLLFLLIVLLLTARAALPSFIEMFIFSH